MQRLRNTGSAKEETVNGIQEEFEVITVAVSYPVRLRCRSHLGFLLGCFFAYAAKPNLPDRGIQAVIFSKIDTYGAISVANNQLKTQA
ncbi:hypothetical protein F4167_10340 [Candidatus Poribacteria bacterium]|nr:hypothetical protein [Candidatus Poribacteria bacterium]